jgi:hypothetical protein
VLWFVNLYFQIIPVFLLSLTEATPSNDWSIKRNFPEFHVETWQMIRHPFWWQTLQTLLQMKWLKNLTWNEEFIAFRISICEVVVGKWIESSLRNWRIIVTRLKLRRPSFSASTSGSIVNKKLVVLCIFVFFLFQKVFNGKSF